MKNTKKTYFIVMTSQTTSEKFMFGEVTMQPGDAGFMKFKLNHENQNHSFELIDKKHCKTFSIDPLNYFN
jgi:hypothetical protein